MHPEPVISFPHMGDYAAVFQQLLGRLLPRAAVLPPPPITRKTVELGSRHSPDFVCAPFKYNLGNYIEALDQGANVLLQTGMGCRYGYYGELQEQILRDLGYNFRFICFSRQRARPLAVLRVLGELGCALPLHRIVQAFSLAVESIRYMDRHEFWTRENIGFQVVPGSCEAVRENLLKNLSRVRSSAELKSAIDTCKKATGRILLRRPEKPLRVGVVGELYTLMEPFSNFYLEKQLAREGIVVSRTMGVWYLLFGRDDIRALGQSGGYLRNTVGANGVDSVAQSLDYAKRGYDGIVHLKSFGCIPELNAAPALQNLARDRGIPVLQLSFDSHTSETAVQTRLEAFADMLRMKKEEKNGGSCQSGGGHWFGVHQRRCP